MIDKLRLNNFQGFKGQQEIRLAPITLIFGPNASGKSSIGRAIRLFAQSMEESAGNGKVGFVFSGRQVSLENLETTVFGQVQTGESLAESSLETIESRFFGVAVELGFPKGFVDGTSFLSNYGVTSVQLSVEVASSPLAPTENKTFNRNYLELHFGPSAALKLAVNQVAPSPGLLLTRDKWGEVLNESLNSTFPGIDFPEEELRRYRVLWEEANVKYWFDPEASRAGLEALVSKAKEQLVQDGGWPQYVLEASVDDVAQDLTIAMQGSLEGLRHNHGFPVDFAADISHPLIEESQLPILSSDVLSNLMALLDESLMKIDTVTGRLTHVPPMREVPKKISLVSEIASEPVDLARFNKWLARLTNERYKLVVEYSQFANIDYGGAVYQAVYDHYTEATVSLDNVGMGLSQVIPVINAAFNLDAVAGEQRDRLVIMEQPELHLHPKMQADVAQMLVDAHLENGNQFLVETHSESILLRVQKLVREGVISREDVAVIYVEPVSVTDVATGKVLERYNWMQNIEMDDVGDLLDPFPISFADLRVQDLL